MTVKFPKRLKPTRGKIPRHLQGLGGHNPYYDNAEDLQHAVDLYFQKIEQEEKPATITGLSYFLGFGSVSSIYSYIKRDDDIGAAMSRARLRVEMHYEELLLGGRATAGAMFALKQMGWKDRQELDVKDDRKVAQMSEEERVSKLKGLVQLVQERQPDGEVIHVPEQEEESEECWLGDDFEDIFKK